MFALFVFALFVFALFVFVASFSFFRFSALLLCIKEMMQERDGDSCFFCKGSEKIKAISLSSSLLHVLGTFCEHGAKTALRRFEDAASMVTRVFQLAPRWF